MWLSARIGSSTWAPKGATPAAASSQKAGRRTLWRCRKAIRDSISRSGWRRATASRVQRQWRRWGNTGVPPVPRANKKHNKKHQSEIRRKQSEAVIAGDEGEGDEDQGLHEGRY